MHLSVLVALLLYAQAAAQAAAPAAQPAPIILGPPPPPATALEAFQVEPGGLLTTAYEELGEVEGILVEAREMRNSRGDRARGIVVTILERQDRTSEPLQAYVDPDEFNGLIHGFDALLAITISPNGEFRNFDMRYATRGELVLTASSTRQRGVVYGVEVGRQLRTRRALNGGEFHQLRTLVEAAQQKLATLAR
jgi:hypothetical protein